MSKSSWNGKEVDYGRRYAIMEGDVQPEYLMPVQFLDDRVDYAALAFRGNIRTRMNGGGLNFVYGGINLQEIVVPLTDCHYTRIGSREYQRNCTKVDTKSVEMSLLSANHKISNMIFSPNLYQRGAVGDNHEEVGYLLYSADSAGKVTSDTTRIIAGKTSDIAQERTFHCTFNPKSLSFDSREIYYLVTADESGLQLPQREEFQIGIASRADEFRFF